MMMNRFLHITFLLFFYVWGIIVAQPASIRNIVPGISEIQVKNHIDGINLAFKDCEINTCLRKIHFLAQILHESGNLRYTKEENVSDTAYDGFPGRGLIQLTGKVNYEKYGIFAREDVSSFSHLVYYKDNDKEKTNPIVKVKDAAEYRLKILKT